MENSLSTQIFEFIKLVISFLLGLSSSFLVNYVTERIKAKKERKKNNCAIYKGIVSTLNSSLRYEFNLEKEKILFNYHRRLSSLPLMEAYKKEIHKEQAIYHQKLQTTYHLLLLDNMKLLDGIIIDYFSSHGQDEKFDALLEIMGKRERMGPEKFHEYSEPEIIMFKKNEAIDFLNFDLNQNMKIGIENIDKHLQKELKIKFTTPNKPAASMRDNMVSKVVGSTKHGNIKQK
jgi:hypothetical protein